MINSIIEKRITKQEERIGESLDYLRYILGTSKPGFSRFVKIMPLTTFRNALPEAAYHVAGLVTTLQEDCGTCVQVEINLARAAGVPDSVLRSVIHNRPEELDDDLRDIYHFTRTMLTGQDDEHMLRSRIVHAYGDAGLVELSLKIATSRVFPIVKRVLGFATSCKKASVLIADATPAQD